MFGFKRHEEDLQMYSDISISVKGVSKNYRVYDKPQDRLKQSFMGNRKQYYKEFWALKDVSFEIRKGETIGIIGKNGSGKSTLLQIVTQILQPSEGEVQINGRVAALLELGSGFNPEFTGRENAYLNGAIMGLTKSEIDERMPKIEEFAEIGQFIDQPVKVYSSGMYVRLAFACAVNVDPDILIVDEALAVGDMRFQLKCINKMKEFKKAGKTILFVSHDTYSVKNFCDQVIWIMDGQIYLRGDVNAVTNQYEDFMKTELDIPQNHDEPNQFYREGEVLSIDSVNVMDVSNNIKSNFKLKESITVLVEYSLYSPMEGIVGGIAIFDKQNNSICALNTRLDKVILPSQPGKHKMILSYDNMNLLPGTYSIDVGFFESSAVVRLDYKSRVTSFHISSGEYLAEGITLIEHHWQNG